MNPIEAKKRSGGRKKIEIKRIEKEESRQVCFSKRRQGLFKKANELCTLCGAEVAIVVFSLAGKTYSFGHPSVDHVIHRFLNDPVPSKISSVTTNSSEQINQELAYLHNNLEEIKQHRALEEALKAPWPVPKPFWWDIDLHLMRFEELREYEKILLEHQVMVAQAAQQGCFYQASEATMGQIDDSPAPSEVREADYFLWLEEQDFELDGYDFNSGV